MQGIQFDMDVLYLFDEHKLGDLAGNAQLAERAIREGCEAAIHDVAASACHGVQGGELCRGGVVRMEMDGQVTDRADDLNHRSCMGWLQQSGHLSTWRSQPPCPPFQAG
eukprot:s4657_g4.t1